MKPLPLGASREGALYPDGEHIKDLGKVRELLHLMQRPGIAPGVLFLLVLSLYELIRICLVGVSTRLEGTRSRLVPQPRFASHRRRCFQARSSSRIPPVQPRRLRCSHWSHRTRYHCMGLKCITCLKHPLFDHSLSEAYICNTTELYDINATLALHQCFVHTYFSCNRCTHHNGLPGHLVSKL